MGDTPSATTEAGLDKELVAIAAAQINAAIDREPHHRRLYPDLYSSAVAQVLVPAVLLALVPMLRLDGVADGMDPYDQGWRDAYEQVVNDLDLLADTIEHGGGAK